MTTVELRTSIMSELDQMSDRMLENVQQYVRRLRRHARPSSKATARSKREAAMLFVKNLRELNNANRAKIMADSFGHYNNFASLSGARLQVAYTLYKNRGRPRVNIRLFLD